MAGYELLEHTADIGVRAVGARLEEAFEQATFGLADVLGAWQPGPGERAPITVEAGDLGALLVDWLEEVLYLQEVGGAAIGAVRVERVADGRATGSVTLRPADPPLEGTMVKAVTYHRLKVEQADGGWVAEVYFDV